MKLFQTEEDNFSTPIASDNEDDDEQQQLLINATKRKPHPGDPRRMMSQKNSKYRTNQVHEMNTHVKTTNISMHNLCSISSHAKTTSESLVDRGANGDIAGNDVRIINKDAHRRVNVRGIDNHEITSIPLVTAGAVTSSQHGEVIVIMNQYAYHPQHKTIHSCGQLEWFYNDVNDKSCKIPGGIQHIKTNDGYDLPLQIKQGLSYLPLRPYTDSEWDNLPHVVLTSDDEWNPDVLDHKFDLDDEQWYDSLEEIEDKPTLNLFDEFGNYLQRTVCTSKITSPADIDY